MGWQSFNIREKIYDDTKYYLIGILESLDDALIRKFPTRNHGYKRLKYFRRRLNIGELEIKIKCPIIFKLSYDRCNYILIRICKDRVEIKEQAEDPKTLLNLQHTVVDFLPSSLLRILFPRVYDAFDGCQPCNCNLNWMDC